MNRETVTYIGLLALLLTPYSLTAAGGKNATSPSASAGVLERQMQRQYNLQDLSPQQDIPILAIDIPKEVLNMPEGISVYVEHILVNRNFPLFDKEIQKIGRAHV